MSFRFNESLFADEKFNDKIKTKLTNLLTKSLVKNKDLSSTTSIDVYNNNVAGSYYSANNTNTTTTKTNTSRSPNFLKDEIKITKVKFPVIPQVEILDMDITTEPRSLIKTIGNISCSNAFIQLETVIESNLLMSTMQTSPSFITPNLIDNNSFKIPITMTFSNIQLEAITNVFMRNHGVSISFNDVSLDFKFDCSIKLLQNTIEKRLKDSIATIFKEVLPSAIFNTSQHWFNQNKSVRKNSIPSTKESSTTIKSENKLILDENDLQDISHENMSRLASIISSRYTLSLHGTNHLTSPYDPNNFINFNGCLERQNLYRFISTMPSLQNFYHINNSTNSLSDKDNHMETHKINNNKIQCTSNNENENYLPQDILDSGTFQLNDIINIQNKLFERNYHNSNNNVQPKRRTVKLKKILSKEQTKQNKINEHTTTIPITPKKQLQESVEETKIENPVAIKLSPRTKEMNKFVDNILNNPLLVTSASNTKKLESPIPSPTLSKSMGFAGLNPYNSLWGEHSNHACTTDITKSHIRRLSTPSPVHIQTPPISPPPYSSTKY